METDKKVIKLATIFYLCSIIGYVYELVITYFYENKVYSHGILTGPWLPIYGTGAVLVTLILNKYRKNPVLIFVLSFFITGLLEYICGFILLKFFKMRLWDYTGSFLNIDGFVCFLSAFCFGIGGLLIIYLINPLVEKIIKKIKRKHIITTLILLTLAFFIDIIFAIIK